MNFEDKIQELQEFRSSGVAEFLNSRVGRGLGLYADSFGEICGSLQETLVPSS
jgi:hypothetical protein